MLRRFARAALMISLVAGALIVPGTASAGRSPLVLAPPLLSPTDGSEVASTLPRFDWQPSGAQSYVFELSATPVAYRKGGGFALTLLKASGLTQPTYTAGSPLSAGGGYAWHVAAKVSASSMVWSQTWTFTVAAAESSGYVYERTTDPPGTVVRDASSRLLATFTDGARTVTLAGPSRTFSEGSAADPVVSSTWVRLLPAPFTGDVDEAWLTAALADRTPDVLAIAMQYVAGAPPVFDGSGLQIAGDASFGPLQPDGTRAVGSDFNDYLGVLWTYGNTVDQPEPDQYLSLDCSGFVRMVYGYRSGVPVSLSTDGVRLPRRAADMLASAPGVVTVPDSGLQVIDLSSLAPGDLVFFDVSTNDGTQIDHVGIFLGRDTAGHYRFISSRKTPDGPTLGDTAGKAILDGTGFYASAFRAVRRL